MAVQREASEAAAAAAFVEELAAWAEPVSAWEAGMAGLREVEVEVEGCIAVALPELLAVVAAGERRRQVSAEAEVGIVADEDEDVDDEDVEAGDEHLADEAVD